MKVFDVWKNKMVDNLRVGEVLLMRRRDLLSASFVSPDQREMGDMSVLGNILFIRGHGFDLSCVST